VELPVAPSTSLILLALPIFFAMLLITPIKVVAAHVGATFG
jgi:hypothetical protein